MQGEVVGRLTVKPPFAADVHLTVFANSLVCFHCVTQMPVFVFHGNNPIETAG
jgi:hypothetical protein